MVQPRYSQKRAWNPTLLLAVLAVMAVAAVAGYLALKYAAAPPPAALTPEAKAYVRSLGLSGVEMKAAESYMGSTLVEITGRIQNNGDRPLRLVELNCVFYDVGQNVIHRERVPIVKRSALGSLKPGESRPFRMPFDSIPDGWNQALPQLVIANIEFER